MELDGKVAIVTGGAGSLGLASARRMVEEGARVMLVDRDQARLEAACATLGPQAAWFAGDVADAAVAQGYVAKTTERWGRVDVLFSNAGNDGPVCPVTDYDEAIFDSIMRVHVRGTFLACKYTLPSMQAGSSVIITSSTTGVGGAPGVAPYTAAKHALVGLMRSLAREVAGRGIRVNTINPGPVDNEFMRRAEDGMTARMGRDASAMFNERIPMGRHGTPPEVAEAVLFLASARSSYVSGTTFMVDGALTS